MRLLDRIVQSRMPLVIARGDALTWLPGPAIYAAAVAACPLRLVLSESLTRTCAALAYADGDRLSGCLDLIHVPAQRLWVEWPDGPRRETVAAALGEHDSDAFHTARAGVYLQADAAGRRGLVRTFWGSPDESGELSLAPLITEFDLEAGEDDSGSIADVFSGASARVRVGEDALDDLLRPMRFRFDAGWAAYYRHECRDAGDREAVLRASLASVATDLPVLFALFLLMSSRTKLIERSVNLSSVNRRRLRAGRAPLLDHVELLAPVANERAVKFQGLDGTRGMPRLHHVRGHLVRRGSQVFWRVPHVRGRANAGHVRTRTVTLEFERPSG